MRVSTQFPVAVHALLMVAFFPEQRLTSDMVAQSVGCNPVLIRNLFIKLKKAGLLSVRAGRGKTELGRSACDITLWDVYAAVEPVEETFQFRRTCSGACPVGGHIRDVLQGHLDGAVSAMRDKLSGVTLAALDRELHAIQPGGPGCEHAAR